MYAAFNRRGFHFLGNYKCVFFLHAFIKVLNSDEMFLMPTPHNCYWPLAWTVK